MQKQNNIPSFFKYAYLSSASGKFGEAISVSMNTLLVALGASAFQIAFVNAVHHIAKAFSSFVGLWYLNLFESRKKSQITSMVIIGLPTILLAIIALIQAKYWFLIVTFIMFFEGLTGKASYLCFFTWMSSIVGEKFRNHFFGTRNFSGEIGKITGFILAYFVLELNYPILFILASLYFVAYIFHNIETVSYFYHPEAKRKKLIKNHIIKRMLKTVSNKDYINYISWYIILNSVLFINVLYLEYFMIHDLKLSYSWIPVSFIILTSGTAASLHILKKYFSYINYSKKRFVISIFILLSSIFWLITTNITLLVISLFIAGFSTGALTLSEKVDLIKHSENEDKEAYFATFNFLHPISTSLLTLFLGISQVFEFSFSNVFYLTITLTLFSFIFLNNIRQKT